MALIRLYMTISLDGYVAGPQDSADAWDQAADERDRAADEQVSSQTRKTEQRLPGHASASACPATCAAHRLAGRATVSCGLGPYPAAGP